METERKGKPLVEFKSLSNVVLGDAAGFSDEITSLAVGARVAALGTRMGSIFVLEHGVNVIRKISTNNACIHALGLDVAGRFCVSGAGDGRITVWSLGPGSEPWVTEHSQLPILGVALAPDQSEEKLTLCAAGEDGRLVLHQRVMFGGQTVLHAGEGPITEVLWRTSLIAWMNDRGVKVYNVKSGRKVTYVARPSRAKGCLTWLSDDQLAMSWGSLVKIAVLVTTGDLQIAEVRHQFNCGDVTIQGLMPLGRQLAALESDGRRTSLRFSSNSGDLFHAVEVPMSRGAFHSHLHLAAAAPHLPMYLTGPREFLVFQVRDLLEYAVQLLEEKRFDEAIRLANSVGHGIEGLGHIVCIKSLGPDVQEGNYERACQILQRFSLFGFRVSRQRLSCATFFERMASYASLLLACCLGMASMHLVFVAQGSPGSSAPQTPSQVSSAQLPGAPDMEDNGMAQAALRFGSGLMLGLVLLAFGQPTFADVEDVVIPVDDKGKTTTLTKEQVVRGKRLFIAACASCHVGGGTRTNQNVGLAIEELSGAQPNRATVEGLVDYLNNPTTYDGLKDISEVHPSIKGGDIWPKMISMKQQDLYDMSAYILYQNQTIPEKWGGGKVYY